MDSIEYEALRRASQMQRSNPSGNSRSEQNRQNPVLHQNSKKTEAEREAPPCREAEKVPAQICHNEGNMLSNIFEDKEKLLILALILILSSEESQDPSLTLALLYLII